MGPSIVALCLARFAAGVIGWLGVDYVDAGSRRRVLAGMFRECTVVRAFLSSDAGASMIAIFRRCCLPRNCCVTITACETAAALRGFALPSHPIAAACAFFVLMVVMFPANVHAARCRPAEVMTSRLDVRNGRGDRVPSRCRHGGLGFHPVARRTCKAGFLPALVASLIAHHGRRSRLGLEASPGDRRVWCAERRRNPLRGFRRITLVSFNNDFIARRADSPLPSTFAEGE